MLTFRQFIVEKYVPPNEGSLYHFIDDQGIHSALKHDILSPIDYMHKNWTPSNPSPIMKSEGHVSLTRDPSLNFGGRQIRLKLNRQSLMRAGHSPTHYYDPFMHVPGDWSRDTPASDPNIPHELKHIESEERVSGQIPNLNKHIEEIGITENKYDELKRTIESSKKNLNHLESKQKMAKKGMFWHNSSKTFKPIENERQANVAKRDLEDSGNIYHENIKKTETILNHPKLKIYKNFT
jgi:hypothetical protein